MVRLATCALTIGLALASIGCLGSETPESAPRRTGTSSPTVGPLIELQVRYSVGGPERSRRAVHTPCPTGATCTIERVPHASPAQWVRGVHRSLTCDPAGGDYPDPAAACRALKDLRRLLATRHPACFCPAVLAPAPRAAGTIDGRRAVVPLDFCSICGADGHGSADLAVLTPS